MKVDGLGIVLAIILLPIILVVTYYVQMQVDTIATENQYNTKLLDATYDAMSAFEMNTANEELSNVADSMRSLVLASNNIFLNTLATNFGVSNASKENIQPYIPAVLYTMYDGYYIYAPTETAKVAEKKEEKASDPNNPNSEKIITTQGFLSVGDPGTESLGGTYGDIVYEGKNGGYTVNKKDAKAETDYVLKSYVQYSARYAKDNIDVTINYTLDNYLNIVGKVGEVYYTKTGYLIKDGLVTEPKITVNGAEKNIDLSKTNEDDAKNAILGVKTNAPETTIKAADSASVKVNGISIDSNFAKVKGNAENAYNRVFGETISISTMSEAEEKLQKFYEKYENDSTWKNNLSLLNFIQDLECEIGKCKAVAYYISSACFSNWVYGNLSDLTYGDMQDKAVTGYYTDEEGNLKYESTSGAGVDDLYYSFENNTTKIFDKNQDPEDTESNFNTHKMEVIKNSIKYNLNLSMSAYSKMEHPYDCSLPILLDEEWDKILSNISIVSFMQGWNCGLKIYNNYQIVSSTNNELTVTPNEIYYTKKEEFNQGAGNYHRIDCPYLAENENYISFKSKEVKYDKVNNDYDHKNLACYTCINTSNYDSLFAPKNDAFYGNDKKYTAYYDRISSLKQSKTSTTFGDGDDKKRAAYISLAKERQNVYKTNALPVSEGYEIFKDEKTSSNSKIENISLSDLTNVKQLQITMEVTKNEPPSNTSKLETLTLEILGSNNSNKEEKDIKLEQSISQTIKINVSNWGGDKIAIQPKEQIPNGYSIEYKVKSIKVIYK